MYKVFVHQNWTCVCMKFKKKIQLREWYEKRVIIIFFFWKIWLYSSMCEYLRNFSSSHCTALYFDRKLFLHFYTHSKIALDRQELSEGLNWVLNSHKNLFWFSKIKIYSIVSYKKRKNDEGRWRRIKMGDSCCSFSKH